MSNRLLHFTCWDTHNWQKNKNHIRSSQGKRSRAYRMHQLLARLTNSPYEVEKKCKVLIGTLGVDFVIDNHIGVLVKYPHSSLFKNIGHVKNNFMTEAAALLKCDPNINHVVSLVIVNKKVPNDEDTARYIRQVNHLPELEVADYNIAKQTSFIGIYADLPNSIEIIKEFNNEIVARKLHGLTSHITR